MDKMGQCVREPARTARVHISLPRGRKLSLGHEVYTAQLTSQDCFVPSRRGCPAVCRRRRGGSDTCVAGTGAKGERLAVVNVRFPEARAGGPMLALGRNWLSVQGSLAAIQPVTTSAQECW